MIELSRQEIAERVNALSFKTTAGFIQLAQEMHQEELPAAVTAAIILDAALMSAASFIRTAVMNGAVGLALPMEQLLHTRLDELLAMEARLHPRLADGSFDPVGLTRN